MLSKVEPQEALLAKLTTEAAVAGKETGPPVREILLKKLLERGKPTMSLDEYADLMGIGRNLAFSSAHRGEIATIRLGKRILVLTVPLAETLCGKAAK